MTTQQFSHLLVRVRSLSFQFAITNILENPTRFSKESKFLQRDFRDLDHLERNFSGRASQLTFADVSTSCDDCDPFDLAAFPDQIEVVWDDFSFLVSAASLLASTGPTRGIDPVIDEAIGLLQTQSVNVRNRFEDLQAAGANIDESVYEPLAAEAALAASVFWKRLHLGEDSITFDELQVYKSRRRDTISAPVEYFLGDLKGLRDYLLELLRVDPALFA